MGGCFALDDAFTQELREDAGGVGDHLGRFAATPLNEEER